MKLIGIMESILFRFKREGDMKSKNNILKLFLEYCANLSANHLE